MSDVSTILAALDTAAVASIAGLTAGNIIRGAELGEHLTVERIPALLWREPEQGAEPLRWAQEDLTWAFEAVIVSDVTTDDAMAALVEAFRDELRKDPSQGVTLLDAAWLESYVLRSDPRAARRYAELVVTARGVGG